MIPAKKSPLVERWFFAYNRRYLQRSFHTLHLLGSPEAFTPERGIPIVVYFNHSSWWDLLLGIYLNDVALGWDSYGVMDERQVMRYRFFSKLGVIGVDRTSLRGAKEFLDYAVQLLAGKSRALWIAPQGEIASNLQRPFRFQSGIGHLAEALGEFYLLALAFEYEFWSEKQPEAFVSFAPVEHVKVGEGFDRRAFTRQCERRLESLVDDLAAVRARRDPALFRPLFTGRAGISPVYDAVRALSARLRGEKFRRSHGEVVTPSWKTKPPPTA
jgi:1-acyl-sn-glycerol-3-phosphate acyltransferase